jgi:translation initiation factor 2-alpha kinase 4
LADGPVASAAEVIAVTATCFRSFPTLEDNLEIRISHAKSRLLSQFSLLVLTGHAVKDLVLSRIPEAYRDSVLDILAQPKTSSSEKRSQLLQQGILRSVADELQVLNEPGTGSSASDPRLRPKSAFQTESELGDIIAKVEKSCPALAPAIAPFLDEIRQVLRYMHILGVTLPVVLHPLAGGKGGYFRDGICFEVARRKKRTDIFASGGRCVTTSHS